MKIAIKAVIAKRRLTVCATSHNQNMILGISKFWLRDSIPASSVQGAWKLLLTFWLANFWKQLAELGGPWFPHHRHKTLVVVILKCFFQTGGHLALEPLHLEIGRIAGPP